jgi:hypothetical protein
MGTYIFTQLSTFLQLYLSAAGPMSPDGQHQLQFLQDFDVKIEKLQDLMGFGCAGSVFASEMSKDGMATYKTYMTLNGPPKGFWALSPAVPFSSSKLKMIPKEAVTFSIGQFDVAGLYDLIMDCVKVVDESFHAQAQGAIEGFCSQLAGPDNGQAFCLRDDLLGSLGTEMVTYKLKSKGMAMMGAPPVVFLIEVKDYDRYIGALDSIFSGLSNINSEVGSFLAFKNIDYDGHAIHYIQLQNMPMVPIQPSFTKIDGYMAMTFGINDIKKLIKTYGKSETSILDNEDFMSFYSKLPEGKELLSISYTDVREEFGSAYEQITPMIPMLTMGLPADIELPVDFMLLPTSECITKHLFSSIRATYAHGDGCMTVKYGPFGPEMARVIIPLVAGLVAGTVLFTGIDEPAAPIPLEALPDVEADPALQAKKDLGSLAGACMVYKIEHGNFPERLENLLVPTDAYPEGFYPPKKLPVDPWGNPYQYALKSVKPLPKIVSGNHQYMIWSTGPNGIDEFGEGDDIAKLK